MRHGDLSFRENPFKDKGERERRQEREMGERKRKGWEERMRRCSEKVFPVQGGGKIQHHPKVTAFRGRPIIWLLCFCLGLRSGALRSFLHLR